MAKVNIKSEKSFLSENFITQTRHFMRFHLTKSSTVLLVLVVLPATDTNETG